MAETPRKRGKNMIRSEDGKPFKKGEDQSRLSEAKKKGWAEKRLLKNLLNIITDKKFNAKQNSDWRQLASEFFGIPAEEITVETMMEFRQFEKAINNGDTYAYNAIKDRVYGKPKQSLDIDADVNFETAVYIGKKKLRKD